MQCKSVKNTIFCSRKSFYEIQIPFVGLCLDALRPRPAALPPRPEPPGRGVPLHADPQLLRLRRRRLLLLLLRLRPRRHRLRNLPLVQRGREGGRRGDGAVRVCPSLQEGVRPEGGRRSWERERSEDGRRGRGRVRHHILLGRKHQVKNRSRKVYCSCYGF